MRQGSLVRKKFKTLRDQSKSQKRCKTWGASKIRTICLNSCTKEVKVWLSIPLASPWSTNKKWLTQSLSIVRPMELVQIPSSPIRFKCKSKNTDRTCQVTNHCQVRPRYQGLPCFTIYPSSCFLNSRKKRVTNQRSHKEKYHLKVWLCQLVSVSCLKTGGK